MLHGPLFVPGSTPLTGAPIFPVQVVVKPEAPRIVGEVAWIASQIWSAAMPEPVMGCGSDVSKEAR
jgi:hypothetical protein